MTSREFCYWLQGYFEIDDVTANHPGEEALTGKQVEMIRKHLDMVFVHEIDPSYGNKKKQDMLNAIHTPNVHPPKTGMHGDDVKARC